MDVSKQKTILLGGGEGGVRATGRGGGRFFTENPRRGGGFPRTGGWGKGGGRVSAENFLGGGLNI